MKRNKILLYSFIALLGFIFVSQASFADDDDRGKYRLRFQYAAKVICGNNPNPTRILPGVYRSAINIHNSSSRRANIKAKLALTFPPPTPAFEPGAISQFRELSLKSNQALEIDCAEIPSEFFEEPLGPPYLKGFLIIQSTRSLDVVGVYTASSNRDDPQVDNFEILQIPERRIFGKGD